MSVEVNELLLRTLNRADTHGFAGLTVGFKSYLVVSGNFPAAEMTLPDFAPTFSMPMPDPETEPLKLELAKRRIADVSALSHGYFIDGTGQVLVADELLHLPHAIKTEDAVTTVADSEWSEVEDFFGEILLRLGHCKLVSVSSAPQ